MKWDDYHRRYRVFAVAMQETNLVALVASKALANFPANLPTEWRPAIVSTLRAVGSALGEAVQLVKEGAESGEKSAQGDGPKAVEGIDTGPHRDVAMASFLLLFHRFLAGEGVRHDLSGAAYSQQLTMSFAHLSAFIADSVRAICYARPDVLRGVDRKLEWKAIIDAGDWSTVLGRMVEDFVYKFGWDSIRTCVLEMRKRFGLTIDVPDELLTRIEDAELLRNVLIHDGGRVNVEYLRRSGRTDVRVGELLPVEARVADQLSHDMMLLAVQILFDVSEVHFGIERRTITGVPMDEKRAAAWRLGGSAPRS